MSTSDILQLVPQKVCDDYVRAATMSPRGVASFDFATNETKTTANVRDTIRSCVDCFFDAIIQFTLARAQHECRMKVNISDICFALDHFARIRSVVPSSIGILENEDSDSEESEYGISESVSDQEENFSDYDDSDSASLDDEQMYQVSVTITKPMEFYETFPKVSSFSKDDGYSIEHVHDFWTYSSESRLACHIPIGPARAQSLDTDYDETLDNADDDENQNKYLHQFFAILKEALDSFIASSLCIT